MELLLERFRKGEKATLGSLYLDGIWQSFTLEDRVRMGEKVPGSTSIPEGRYQIKITYSPHFKRDLPLLLDVPNFEGVRIHPGNSDKDTEGCILVGHGFTGDSWLTDSRKAFELLYTKLQLAEQAGEQTWLTVRNFT